MLKDCSWSQAVAYLGAYFQYVFVVLWMTLCFHGHKQVCVQPSTAAVNVTLLAFAAERRASLCAVLRRRAPLMQCCWVPTAVDRHLAPAGHPAANPPHAAAAVNRWDDGQTDRGTDNRDRYIDPAPHTMRARVNN